MRVTPDQTDPTDTRPRIRLSQETVAIVTGVLALAALNLATIGDPREEGHADRATWQTESRQHRDEVRTDRERFQREILRLTAKAAEGSTINYGTAEIVDAKLVLGAHRRGGPRHRRAHPGGGRLAPVPPGTSHGHRGGARGRARWVPHAHGARSSVKMPRQEGAEITTLVTVGAQPAPIVPNGIGRCCQQAKPERQRAE